MMDLAFNKVGNWCDLNNSTHDSFTESYVIITGIMSSLSICGSITLISTIFCVAGLRTKGRMLLVYLSCSDLLLAAGNLFGAVWWDRNMHLPTIPQNSSACVAQAAITSTASLASFFWTSCVALNIYLTVVKQNDSLTAKLHFLTHVICWGVPLTLLVITLTNDRYGLNVCAVDRTWWCWIKPQLNREQHDQSTFPTILWQFVSGKFWEILSYVFVSVLYALVMFDISTYVEKLRGPNPGTPTTSRRRPQRAQSTAYSYANKKLIFVPLVFVLARIWGTVRFFINMGRFSSSSVTFQVERVFAILQGLGDSSQGFLNCMVFILTTPRLREKFPCRKLRITFRTSQSEQLQEENDLLSDTTSSSDERRHNRLQIPQNYGAMESSSCGPSNNNLSATHSGS